MVALLLAVSNRRVGQAKVGWGEFRSGGETTGEYCHRLWWVKMAAGSATWVFHPGRRKEPLGLYSGQTLVEVSALYSGNEF